YAGSPSPEPFDRSCAGPFRCARIASTAIWLATSPAGHPPMPSHTTNSPWLTRSPYESSLRSRTRPVSVAAPNRNRIRLVVPVLPSVPSGTVERKFRSHATVCSPVQARSIKGHTSPRNRQPAVFPGRAAVAGLVSGHVEDLSAAGGSYERRLNQSP